MPVLAPAAVARALPLRKRGDLIIRPLQFGGRRYWGVKDPITLKYFQLRDEEYGILSMLDGEISLEEIRARFESEFIPQRLSLSQLHAFLAMLHQDGLIVADAPGQGEELLSRGRRRQRSEWLAAFSNVLAIRLRGFDPDRLLSALLPWCRPFLSVPCLMLCGLLVLSAAVLVIVRFDTLQTRLPDFQAFFSPRNAVWLVTALALTKVLHELGHALVCKRFGGECHEMGVMLLVFTPCLYCNVSDAWMLPGKWQRVAIGAVGMIVELTLAAVCTFLWWFSEPGWLNSLCLNLMFVCSTGTLLFNGNPLLRYDGYYILADIIEVPNLQQQSDALLRRAITKLSLGIDLVNERMLPDGYRVWLIVYALASWMYRWFVVGAVLWFTYKVLEPYRLEPLVAVLAMIVLARLLVQPVWRGTSILREQWGNPDMKWRRLLATGVVLASAAAAFCLVPVPHRINVPVVMEPADARRVYVSVAGSLLEAKSAGSVVEKDSPLAKLKSLDVELEVEKLRGQVNQQKLHLANLERRRVSDPAAGAEIPTAQQALADLEERLKQRQQDQQRLTLLAPMAGTVIAPPRLDRKTTADELPHWSGSPLDEKNVGTQLETGTLFCLIGNPQRLEALLVIDQADIEFIRSGQNVEIQLDESPGNILEGTITEVGELDLEVTPRELLANGDIPTRPDDRGVPRPLSTLYHARVELSGWAATTTNGQTTSAASSNAQLGSAANPTPLIGATGRAKIHAPAGPLGPRAYRFLRRTFHFEL